MKTFLRTLALAACVLMIFGSIPAAAIIPYSTYTYDIDGTYMESPHAYVPYEIIDTKVIGLNDRYKLTNPSDIFVESFINDKGEQDYNIYISDPGKTEQDSKKVVAINSKYELIGIIDTYVNEWGVPDKIREPRGLFADSGVLYVADKSGNRVLSFSTKPTKGENGKLKYDFDFVKTISQPENDVIADGIYQPIAVAVDKAGRIYVVSASTHQGIISMNPDGSFSGFLGAQKVSVSIIDALWRSLQTAEQRRLAPKFVATEYNNLTIDSGGFVYATTSSISESAMMNAIRSKSRSGDYAPVKKLNPEGTDVMKRTGFYPPSGEVTVNTAVTNTTTITGPSRIIDVALGPDGVWSIIDEKREKVYTYDEDGKLLYIFGDQGNQLGNLQSLSAIDYMGTNMLLLDQTNCNIVVMKRTEYGDLLAKAIKNQRDRLFSEAVNDWTSILQRNSNFDMSYVGIGKSLYRSGEWKKAMDKFKYAYDVENYSKAFHELRKEWVEKYIILIPIFIVVICIAISKLFKYANRENLKEQVTKDKRTLLSEYLYGFHVIFHPFDGFWDIKHEKRASMKGALLILGITIISFIYQGIGKGYVLEPNPKGINILLQITSILLPVLLWAIANWCLTTLFDGEGSLRDIFIATCYSLFPLPAFVIITTFASNFITSTETSIISLALNIAYFWVGFLLFFGMMVIHDYTLFKNVLTSIGSIVGMAFIMFVGVLFSSLLSKIFGFVYNIVLELSYRM